MRGLFVKVVSGICSVAFVMTASAVEFQGAFSAPGHYLPAGGRLLAGLQAAKPHQAYYLAGAVYRHSAKPAQEKLKRSVLYDLSVANAATPAVAQRLQRLAAGVSNMPVTGRIRAELLPEILASQFDKNIWLGPADSVYLPTRPKGVYVTGSVAKPGWYANAQGDWQVARLMRNLAQTNHKTDWVWLAQPDGMVQKVGVALWNRQLEVVAAPGAVIVVPFDAQTMRAVEPDFSARLARWLATQPLHRLGGL